MNNLYSEERSCNRPQEQFLFWDKGSNRHTNIDILYTGARCCNSHVHLLARGHHRHINET